MKSKLARGMFATLMALLTGAIVFTLAFPSGLGVLLTVMFSVLTVTVVLGMFLV